jgi:hypothetical protein
MGVQEKVWRVSAIAFFFGPIAGAMVSVVSLRRMGYTNLHAE